MKKKFRDEIDQFSFWVYTKVRDKFIKCKDIIFGKILLKKKRAKKEDTVRSCCCRILVGFDFE